MTTQHFLIDEPLRLPIRKRLRQIVGYCLHEAARTRRGPRPHRPSGHFQMAMACIRAQAAAQADLGFGLVAEIQRQRAHRQRVGIQRKHRHGVRRLQQVGHAQEAGTGVVRRLRCRRGHSHLLGGHVHMQPAQASGAGLQARKRLWVGVDQVHQEVMSRRVLIQAAGQGDGMPQVSLVDRRQHQQRRSAPWRRRSQGRCTAREVGFDGHAGLHMAKAKSLPLRNCSTCTPPGSTTIPRNTSSIARKLPGLK